MRTPALSHHSRSCASGRPGPWGAGRWDNRPGVAHAGTGYSRTGRPSMRSLVERWRAWWDRGAALARRVTERLWAVARDPLRVLPVVAVVALLAIAVPLTVTGLTRGHAAMDWRRQSTIDWRSATGHVDRVKIDDGLVLDLRYRDRHDDAHRVQAFVGDANGKWVGASVPIRYDVGDPQSVELVGYGSDDPIPALLLAGAPLGAGIAGIVLAISLFRRRALVAVSADRSRPCAVRSSQPRS